MKRSNRPMAPFEIGMILWNVPDATGLDRAFLGMRVTRILRKLEWERKVKEHGRFRDSILFALVK